MRRMRVLAAGTGGLEAPSVRRTPVRAARPAASASRKMRRAGKDSRDAGRRHALGRARRARRRHGKGVGQALPATSSSRLLGEVAAPCGRATRRCRAAPAPVGAPLNRPRIHGLSSCRPCNVFVVNDVVSPPANRQRPTRSALAAVVQGQQRQADRALRRDVVARCLPLMLALQARRLQRAAPHNSLARPRPGAGRGLWRRRLLQRQPARPSAKRTRSRCQSAGRAPTSPRPRSHSRRIGACHGRPAASSGSPCVGGAGAAVRRKRGARQRSDVTTAAAGVRRSRPHRHVHGADRWSRQALGRPLARCIRRPA